KPLQHSLTYYSVEESQFYCAHLDELLNPEYLKSKLIIPKEDMFIRPLLQDEQNFIENEKILSQNDFSYWATHYAWIESVGITSELSKTKLFEFWTSQKMLLSVMAMLE